MKLLLLLLPDRDTCLEVFVTVPATMTVLAGGFVLATVLLSR